MDENAPIRETVGNKPKRDKRLDPRRKKYLKGVIAGKSKGEAALDAGFPESMARSPRYAIETPELRAALARMIHIVAPLEKMAEVMAEGLNAQKTEFEGKGEQMLATPVADHQERGRWWDRAVKHGYAPESIEVNVNHTHSTDDRLAQLIGRAMARGARALDAGGES